MDLCSKLNQHIQFSCRRGRKTIWADILGHIPTRWRDTLREDISVEEDLAEDIFKDFIFAILYENRKINFHKFFLLKTNRKINFCKYFLIGSIRKKMFHGYFLVDTNHKNKSRIKTLFHWI